MEVGHPACQQEKKERIAGMLTVCVCVCATGMWA